MKITLDFRNPTPSHCDVAVFINGTYSGTLIMRQDEIGSFHQIIDYGLSLATDEFLSTGNPDAPAATHGAEP